MASPPTFSLVALPGRLAVWRLPGDDPPPPDQPSASLCMVARTAAGLTGVGPESLAPAKGRVERGWRALEVAGPLDLGLTGVLAELTTALAEAQIPVFAISTYDTDYLLVGEERLGEAVAALEARGHTVALDE